MNRRHVLGLLGGSLTAAMAGCLGGDDDDNGDDPNGDDANGDDQNGDDPNGEPTEGPVPRLAAMDINQQAAEATVVEGDTLSVAVDVENTGDEAGSFEVTLSVDDHVSETESTADVAVEGTETVTFEHDTGELGPGEFTVTAETGDELLTGAVTIEPSDTNGPPAPAFFQPTDLDPQDIMLDAGEVYDLSATIENQGDQAATQTIELSVNGYSETTELTLGPGETDTVTFPDIDLSELGDGQYVHTIATEDREIMGTVTYGDPDTGNGGER